MLVGHAVAHGHGILAASLVLLEVLVVGHLLLLLVGHVAGVHAGTHVRLPGWHVVLGDVLGSLGRRVGSVDPVLVGGRVRRVQASLHATISVEYTMQMMATYLDQVLALGLGHQRLELGGGESIDETGLGNDQEQHLGAGQDGQLVGLLRSKLAANSHSDRVKWDNVAEIGRN